MSALVAGISRYHGSGEINFRVQDAGRLIDRIEAQAGQLGPVRSVSNIDGIRIEYDDWWFCLRRSNTEPLLRLVLEARSRPDMLRYKELLAQMIQAQADE
ncbi:MAG: hypothetical protein R3E68_14705 [Burkholderiaceae bacterium]